MKVIFIIGCIVLALFLLSLIRVGGMAEFSEGGLLVRARLGLFRLTLFPLKEKKKLKKKPRMKKKKPKKKKKQTEPPPPKRGGAFALVQKFLPLVADEAGRFRRKIRVDRLYVDFTAAAGDPAAAAMAFGLANASIGMLWPLLAHNFNIKEHRIRTAVDFNAKMPKIYLYAAFSLTLGRAVALSLGLLLRVLKLLSAQRAEGIPALEKTPRNSP